jgi:ABC-type Fe3+ transport system permease subunit
LKHGGKEAEPLTAAVVANQRRPAGLRRLMLAHRRRSSISRSSRFPRRRRPSGKEALMNLVVWLPALFALGLVSMGVCYAFVSACEEI